VNAVLNERRWRVANEDVSAVPAFNIDYGVVYCSEQAAVW
jgi:hypothetical protein